MLLMLFFFYSVTLVVADPLWQTTSNHFHIFAVILEGHHIDNLYELWEFFLLSIYIWCCPEIYRWYRFVYIVYVLQVMSSVYILYSIIRIPIGTGLTSYLFDKLHLSSVFFFLVILYSYILIWHNATIAFIEIGWNNLHWGFN